MIIIIETYHRYVMNNFADLASIQVERRLFKLKRVVGISIPKIGWIKTIRSLYQMTGEQLGRKMGIVQARVSMAEKAEIEHKLTLESLYRFADALNCDVFYTLIPREPTRNFIKKKAQQKAMEEIKKLANTMELEKQGISKKERQRHYRNLVTQYIQKPSQLWDEQ